jgi:hypothetical protein
MIPVGEQERARVAHQAQLAALQHLAELIAEHRDEHFGGELLLDRVPVDVEIRRVHRARAVLEHVHPPGVRRADAHVVGHEVEELSHAVLGDRGAQLIEACRAAELFAQRVVVDHVIAVRRAGGRAEGRRNVDVGNAELVQVGHDRGSLSKTERRSELESIGRDGAAHRYPEALGAPTGLSIAREKSALPPHAKFDSARPRMYDLKGT